MSRRAGACVALAIAATAAVLAVAFAPVTAAPAAHSGLGPETRALGPAAIPATDRSVRIAAVYPNPATDGDRGEFVVLTAPPETNLGDYALGDDDASVALPNRTVGGRLVLSTAPNATEGFVDGPVLPLSDTLELANSGETVVLRRGNRTVDRLQYSDASSAELRVRGTERWRPLGATDRPVVTADAGEVTVFTLPDAPRIATETLASADRRVLLAGYTLTDPAVADELVAARRRNVSVRVLVDAEPVGGMARRQATLLSRLAAAGIEVRVLGGKRTRYEFHHAKYAVVDDRALVATENWKPAGLGGNGSRGWGVVTRQPRIVDGLVATFRADAGWSAARNWTTYRRGETFEDAEAANATYPTAFRPRSVHVEQTRLLVAPDNAESAVVGLIDNATESIAVEQMSIGSRRQPFLRATLDAARRGVRVRILLSRAWYVAEQNRRLVEWLNERAASENLPLEARLAEPRGRFGKIHAKGLVVDGEHVVVGSLNWNNHSARQNREVVLVLDGEEAGAYFQRVFAADWPAAPPLSAGLLAAVVLAGLVAARVASGMRFEE